jgi:8-oxo-dGTP diphosphatase
MPTTIAIAVVRRNGQFLIGLRPAGAPLAGLWEFPGGKVLPGETPAAAAARECLEETGIAIDVGAEQGVVAQRYAHGDVELHFFDCTPRNPLPAVDPRFRWVPAADLGRYEFPAANAPLIERLVLAAEQHPAQLR